MEKVAIFMPKAPQNIEVMAPARNATVVYQVVILSTHIYTMAPMMIMNMEQILYSDAIKADAPFRMIAPIYITPGCYVFNSLS